MEFSFKISARISEVLQDYVATHPNQDILVNKTRFRGSASREYLIGVSSYLKLKMTEDQSLNPMVRVAGKQVADQIDSLVENGPVGAGLIGA